MAFDALTAVAAPAPVRPAAPADHAATGGTSFAALLDRSREARQAAPDPARDKAADRADDTRDGTVDDTSDAAEPQTPAHAARRADRAPAQRRTEHSTPGQVDTAAADAPAPVDKARAADTTAPADPTLPPWLAALHPPPAQAAEAAASGDGVINAGPAATAALQGTAAPALPAASPRPEDARDAKVDTAMPEAPPALRAEAAATDDKTASVATVADRPASPQTDMPPHPIGATPLAPLQRAAEPVPAAPTAATLATPVESPEFAATLGVQVSVFAREGVHQAELQLNPTEMGPVSVQIALDGTQARVHFGAEVAATRQAIEASLPQLAAALREAGFTLSGGGVSQQRSGRGSESESGADGSPRRNRAVAGENGVTPRVATRRVALGGVDLYA